MTQRWLPVRGYEGLYLVSDEGRIRNEIRGTELGGSITDKGYVRVGLYRDGACSHLSVHSIVLTAFSGSRPSGLQAAHINGNRADNRLTNLIWATAKENHSHKRLHGTEQTGTRNGASKLTESAVLRATERVISGETVKAIAADLGVHPDTIANALRGDYWKHVRRPLVGFKRGRGRIGGQIPAVLRARERSGRG